MHTEADIPIVADDWLAGVQTHADPDRRTVRPLVLRERVLGRNRGLDGLLRASEREEERISLTIDLAAVPRLDSLTQDPSMLGKHIDVAIAELPEQPRRSLDVCEQEGD